MLTHPGATQAPVAQPSPGAAQDPGCRFSRVVGVSDSQCVVATVLGSIPASSYTVESVHTL